MFLRTWIKGWRDKAVVVEDGISAGSQDEGMTRHHSSSPRGPRPRLNDTPPRQSSSAPPPTDFADPLGRPHHRRRRRERHLHTRRDHRERSRPHQHRCPGQSHRRNKTAPPSGGASFDFLILRGARGIRTPDLLIANETRYQLRHSPKCGPILASPPAVLASSVAVSPPTAPEPPGDVPWESPHYSPAARRPSRMASRSMGWKSSSSSSTGAGM